MARQLGPKGLAMGRYERNEINPSIGLVAMADILGMSFNYLSGCKDVQSGSHLAERIMGVTQFQEEDQRHIYSVFDTFIAKRKIQSIM